MSRCTICGSYAINHHLHGRTTGKYEDLCDVCYWRTSYDTLRTELDAALKRARKAEADAHQAIKTLKGLERVAGVVSDNSDQVCGENNQLRTANQRLEGEAKRLREALTDLLGCPASVVQTTVPKAGIEAAPPYQVVLDVSVSLTRWNKAKAALAGTGGDV